MISIVIIIIIVISSVIIIIIMIVIIILIIIVTIIIISLMTIVVGSLLRPHVIASAYPEVALLGDLVNRTSRSHIEQFEPVAGSWTMKLYRWSPKRVHACRAASLSPGVTEGTAVAGTALGTG